MKNIMAIALLVIVSACDGPGHQGSDRQIEQRQEQMEKEKHQDIKHLDREMEKDLDRREVNSQNVNFTPANQ